MLVEAGSHLVDRRDSVAEAEAEGAGFQPNYDSSRAKGPVGHLDLGLPIEVQARALAHPTVGPGEPQHRQLGTVADAHPAVLVHHAG